MEIHVNNRIIANRTFEVIERKGQGHPDTMSDALAEHLSRFYSLKTMEICGAPLHHNFDKVGLLGGKAAVHFGHGIVTSPIRVLLNGRASSTFAGKQLPVQDWLVEQTREFIGQLLHRIDANRDIVIHYNIASGSSPGHIQTEGANESTRKFWFEPRSLDDLREHLAPHSNDTSAGVGYSPLSQTEKAVLFIERRLNSTEYKATRPWLGSDIKVMAVRTGENVGVTICIPQIADFVPNITKYRENVESCREDLITWLTQLIPDHKIHLTINSSDDYKTPELYLTATGSAIESGDEGLVGRGNRTNGLISLCRPYTMEGACGKNPIYHVGKVYNIAADRIAMGINSQIGLNVEVWIISQRARPLKDPWQVLIEHEGTDMVADICQKITTEVMDNIGDCSEDILKGRVHLY